MKRLEDRLLELEDVVQKATASPTLDPELRDLLVRLIQEGTQSLHLWA